VKIVHPWRFLQELDCGHLSIEMLGKRQSETEERHTRNVIMDEDGKTRGRKERLRGQIGVNTKALSDGCTIGPPADSEYAVEPVGVDTMRPSDCHLC